MNKPDKAGEPSMDEILASIRKIIADEPATASAGPDRRAANPLLESIGSVTRREPPAGDKDARLLPPADRLSEALRALPQTSAFDDDLADLLEDSPAGGTRINGSPLGPSSGRDAGSQSSSEPASAAPAGRPNGTIKTSLDFTAAFPRRKEPEAELVTTADARSSLPRAAEVETSREPVETQLPAKPISTIAEPVAYQATPAAAARPNVAHVMFPELPYVQAAYKTAPDAGRASAAVSSAPAAFPFDPVMPRSFAAAPSQQRSPTAEAAQAIATAIGAAERDTQVAAATALGALAAGLAAASASGAPVRATTLPQQRPQGADATTARSLEDMIADMVRPMLQQWIAENMPRIMEKALRVEVAKGLKPGGKLP